MIYTRAQRQAMSRVVPGESTSDKEEYLITFTMEETKGGVKGNKICFNPMDYILY